MDKRFSERISDLLEFWDEEIDLEVLYYNQEEFKRKKKQIGIIRTAVEDGIEIWYKRKVYIV